MSSQIQNKTIRPSSFVNYSYYHGVKGKSSDSKPVKRHHYKRWSVVFLLLVVAVGYFAFRSPSSMRTRNYSTVKSSKPNLSRSVVSPTKKTSQAPAAATTTTTAVNMCASNTYSKEVLVSISDQHLWACQGTTAMYNSAVITGIAGHADTITPTGTFDIYGKHTDQTLTGCDSTGCWKDPVSYWMPFLDNEYGQYGLHDATWRSPGDFGNISPSSSDGSQGCVELPLATAAWLYNWVVIGTPVTIQN